MRTARYTLAVIVPHRPIAAQNIARLPKPKLPISQPPTADAPSQPMLAVVTFAPSTAPRMSSGTPESSAISDGRPIALKNE